MKHKEVSDGITTEIIYDIWTVYHIVFFERMHNLKVLVLGAGPAGLTFANRLLKSAEDDFVVIEKNESAGGLCRSTVVDGSPFDIGGGHFLDVRNQKANEFLFQFMPRDEWNIYERDSRIALSGKTVHHPIESNIWEMDIDEQVEYLKSIACAGCNIGKAKPKMFVDWIYWKLGNRIADDYMLPYNRKMFGEELNQLGTYWLEKLPDVSFEQTLKSCLVKKPFGTQPGHAQFLYPKKYGYGELWLRMAENIQGYIEYGKSVSAIDFENHVVMTEDGSSYKADRIVTTIPWKEFRQITGMPEEIKILIPELKHRSTQTKYHKDYIETSAQWIYCPDLVLPYHRILVRKNFCCNSDGYWTETNGERIRHSADGVSSFDNEYAYPLNTIDKPVIMQKLLSWAGTKKVYGLGRWGEHKHYNSDVVVERAINLADNF